MIKSMISKGDWHGFLILSKKGINDLFINPDKYDYKIIQIEPGSSDEYIVEVVEKGSGTTILERITKRNKEDAKMGRVLIEQPNGKFMIWSTVVDGPIAYNLTKEEYVDFKKEEAARIAAKLAETVFDYRKFVNNLERYMDTSNLDAGAKEELYDILIDCGYPKEIIEEWVFGNKGDKIL